MIDGSMKNEHEYEDDVELTVNELRAVQLAVNTGFTGLDHHDLMVLKQKLTIAIALYADELPDLEWMGLAE